MRLETKVARVCGTPELAHDKASVGQRVKAREILDQARAWSAEARDELNLRLQELDAAGAAISAALEGLEVEDTLASMAAMHKAAADLKAELKRLASEVS